MKKDDCIFCKIAAGEIGSHTLYEDEDFRVIFDLNPGTKGHALVIPKEHADGIFDMDDETASKVLVVAKKVATAMKEAFNADGFNIIQNNGECAGQSVKHFHMHLFPRYEGDKALGLWKPGKTTDEELQVLEDKVKEILN